MKRCMRLWMAALALITAIASFGNTTGKSGKMDAASRLRMQQRHSSDRRVGVGGDEYVKPRGARYAPAIIKIESDEALEALERAGVRVLRRRDNLLLCFVAIEGAVPVVNAKGVASMALGREHVANLDTALSRYDAYLMHTGDGDRLPYTGKGVVAGFCDIGLDAIHPTFISPSGENRIGLLTQYLESWGVRSVIPTDRYAEWRTDSASEWHATHVGGILAGGGAGTPWIGMAPGAEIAASVSQLSDVGLLAGVEDILEYARCKDMKAVVNLSMGNYLGPHDGTSLFSQYLDKLGEEAIICLSSGNEGSRRNSLAVELGKGVERQEVRIINRRADNFHVYGMSDLWSSTSNPFAFTLGVYDDMERRVIGRTAPLLFYPDGEVVSLLAAGMSDKEAWIAKYFDGDITVAGGVDPENGRYNVALSYDVECREQSGHGAWGRYTLVAGVEQAEGCELHPVEIDFYSDGTYSTFKQAPGGPEPGSAMSVSDLCTGHKVVSVGMYNNRTTEPDLEGGVRPTGYDGGIVCRHSSYGKLIDGRVLPLTVAPGAPLVSSLSGAWIDEDPSRMATPAIAALTDGEWGGAWWIAEAGTSMSSPYVAGAIACWLEADPALNVDDVKSIIESTNRHDIPDPSDPRNGHGWFDPLAGLLETLRRSDAISVEEGGPLRLTYSDGLLGMVNAGVGEANVGVYDANGRKMAGKSFKISDELYLGELPSGIYVAMAISGNGNVKVMKIVR